MLVARNYQPDNLVRPLPAPIRPPTQPGKIARSETWRHRPRRRADDWAGIPPVLSSRRRRTAIKSSVRPTQRQEIRCTCLPARRNGSGMPIPARHGKSFLPRAGAHAATRAYARSLLERLQQMEIQPLEQNPVEREDRGIPTTEPEYENSLRP